MSIRAEGSEADFWGDADESEALQRYRSLVNAVSDGIYQLDAAGRFVAVNDAIVEMTGYERERLIGEPASVLLDEGDVDRIEREIQRRLTGAESHAEPLELTARTAAGDTISCELELQLLVENGTFQGTIGVVRDVTDRGPTERAVREREQELHRKERRYEAIFEDPNILVGLLEPDGTVLDINGTAMDYIDTDLEEVTGKPFWKTPWWSEGDTIRDDVREWTERASDGDYVDFEADLTRPNGEQYTLSGYFRPVTNDDGDVVSIIVSDRDVTERKQRERELEERERRYRTLVENFPDGAVALFDDDLEYTAIGGQYFDDAGIEPDERIGISVFEIYPDDLVTDLEPNFRATLDGEEREFAVEYNDRYLRLHTVPVRDATGEIDAGMIVAQDVTERREYRRKLEESRNQLRALIDVLPVAVFVAEADGEIVEWNEAAEEIWGGKISESESVAEYDQYEAWWADTNEPVAPDEWPLARALEGEEVTDPDEIRIKGFDGEYRTVLNHGMPVRDANGDVSRAVVTLVDITERKEYQRKLEESNERLEQFAYAVSHDLQEPLRMVSSYLQLLENRYEDDLDEDGREFIEFAVDGADRMKAMIEGLLEYSRVETRGDPLEPVDLETVIDDVLADLQFQIEESNADVTADELPRVEGDVSQLRQVFQNLLDNAIEYSGDEPPRIHISAERDGSSWRISVHDEGIGIDPGDQDRIFEVFQRLHSRGEHAGTGIGLALCERIVERHGGEIWVDSEPGEETTFSFTLPASDGQ